MNVINTGSMLEHYLSLILVDLLKADPAPGMAMYQALSGAEARRAALLGAASVALSVDDALLFQAIMTAIAPARRVRNAFAHHLWGDAPDIQNALLLCDPDEFLRVDVGGAAANAQMAKTGQVAVPPEMDRSKIMVWRQTALKEADRAADDALDTVRELMIGLHWFGPGIDGATRRHLLLRLPVAQALQRLKKQNAPEVPPQ